jgi:NADP-dependent 3-hydroxy acid dehydrogenase YdfG
MGKREISGMTVVITGAGRGIGEATAELLSSLGATLALGDLDTELVQRVAERIGRGAVGAHLDVSRAESWTEFLATVGEVGPIDTLVNNAGIMPVGSVLDEPEAVARAILDVNVHGVINGTKAVAPGMVERGHGHIVNVASAVGRIAVAGGATYSASKFAVVGFSEATRAELGPRGVDVSVVLPTVVQTELSAGISSTLGVKPVAARDVAAAIASTIRRPRAELWVPQWAQTITRTTSVLPRPLQATIAKALDTDRVLTDVDRSARAAYEARVRPPGS